MHSPFSLNQRRFRCVNQAVERGGKEDVAQGTFDIRQVVTFSSVVQMARRSPPDVLRQMVWPMRQSCPEARQVQGGSSTGGPGVKGWRWEKAGWPGAPACWAAASAAARTTAAMMRAGRRMAKA
jgi:hypothetical protein